MMEEGTAEESVGTITTTSSPANTTVAAIIEEVKPAVTTADQVKTMKTKSIKPKSIPNTTNSTEPTVTATVTTTDKTTSSRKSSTTSTTAPLPEGWRAVLDKKSNRYYYVHE